LHFGSNELNIWKQWQT